MTDSKTPPREFWIEVNDDNIARHSKSEAFDDAIHVIEKSAYDQLLADARGLTEKLKDAISVMSLERSDFDKLRLQEFKEFCVHSMDTINLECIQALKTFDEKYGEK